MTKQMYKDLGEIVYLDLEKVEIFGQEKYKRILDIAKMVRDIQSGADFPPVLVDMIDEKTYILNRLMDVLDNNGTNYGGHHRALSHWIAGVPLKCAVRNNKHDHNYVNQHTNIKNIILYNKWEEIS